MAGPINGLAGAQQPVSQLSPLQSGQNTNQVRGQDERQRPEENRVQPQNAASAESQEVSADNNNRASAPESGDQVNLNEQAEQRRGSLVDISV